MRPTLEDKERQYRSIYEFFYEIPRIPINEIASRLQVTRHTAKNRLKELFGLGYASIPQIRMRSFANMLEYVYFLSCENPVELFSEYQRIESVIYHATMYGSTNLWVVSKEELDFDCNVLVGGPRSDYHLSYAPNHSWDTAIKRMRKKVENFNPYDYSPERILETHWDETLEWDSEQERLFHVFNYDLRQPISTIQKKNLISWAKIDAWLKNLSEYCTIINAYYPERISSYDPHLFVFETDYEDFLINLFSELPTTSWFFRVSNKLFLYAHVKKEYSRVVDFQIDITRLQIPELVTKLIKKGIVHSGFDAIVQCYWNKDP
ncbi:MAG: hypothetical protein HXS48_16720 [Theionarchaea archaeon]|nr:hypothetical protein [Theionarchaea archaeon]